MEDTKSQTPNVDTGMNTGDDNERIKDAPATKLTKPLDQYQEKSEILPSSTEVRGEDSVQSSVDSDY